MRSLSTGARKKAAIAGLVFGLVLAVIWWQRTPLWNAYALRGLASADESTRAAWVNRVLKEEAAAVPGLIALLQTDDALACANAEAALAALAKRWGPTDSRTATLGDDMAAAFPRLSQPGKEALLEWTLGLLRQVDPQAATAKPLLASSALTLRQGVACKEKGVRLRTLILAEMLLARTRPSSADLYRQLALEGIAATDPTLRAHGIRLAMHAPLQSDETLLAKVVPFLQDKDADVRRASILAVGLADKAISVDDLIGLLQDSDAEVRRLCEAALRGRGLQDPHVKLAKLISDRRPGERLQVVHYLHEAEDLDPGVWLQRLSLDNAPAVRAAAIRFAAEDPASTEFQTRILQMARDDPSPTVRQLAMHYLKIMQRRN